MKQRSVQVAVLGGGTAGSALALLLARAGVSVLVVEEETVSGWKIGEGLPPSAKMVLERLGVWERFVADGHLASHGNRSVWGSERAVDYDFLYDRHGSGWHLDRSKFDEMLAAVSVEAGAVRLEGASVTEWQAADQGGWELQISLEGQGLPKFVTAEFVVDATGRKSWWARQLGVERLYADHLCALAGLMGQTDADRTVSATDRDSFTMIEAVADGWWYTALLPEQKRVVAFLSDGDLPATKAARTTEQWQTMLAQTQHIGPLLQQHGYQLEIEPQMRAANSSRLRTVVGERWLAIGDSAAAYDPLSSQGILMGLGGAIESSQAILRFLKGEPAALVDYATFIDKVFQSYLLNLIHYYDMEQRFLDSPFWSRRSLQPQKQ